VSVILDKYDLLVNVLRIMKMKLLLLLAIVAALAGCTCPRPGVFGFVYYRYDVVKQAYPYPDVSPGAAASPAADGYKQDVPGEKHAR